MEEKISVSLNEDEAVKIILKYDSRGSGEKGKPMIFKCDRHEINAYFAAVDLIVELMGSTNSSDTKMRLEGITQIARDQLKDEFERISCKKVSMLNSYFNHGSQSASYTSSISSSSFLAEYYPELNRQSQDDLVLIAERMRSMQNLQEFVARKSLLLAFLRGVDIMKLSVVDIQKMEWSALEKKIESWIKASQKFLNHFQKEKEMFQTIFEDLGADTNEAHLVEMLEDPASTFFGFAEVVSTCRHSSPERLFKILDLLRNIVLILPMVECACGEKSLESIRILPGKIASQLGDAVKGMLSKFENLVQSDLTYITTVKEAIHPLTQYVMFYVIRMITGYKDLLLGLVLPDPPTMQNLAADGSRLASGLVLILHALI